MAKRGPKPKNRDNGEDQNPGQGHNSGESVILSDPAERKALIDKTVREVALLESQRKELGEKIRALKSNAIKGRLGMKIGDFNATFRLFNLDDEGRTTFLSTMRECFHALDVGEQLDFLAQDPVPQRPAENMGI